MNRLYYGDCLTIMRDHMKLGSVDLIYLDPPFNSNREYAIYKDETGKFAGSNRGFLRSLGTRTKNANGHCVTCQSLCERLV